MKPFDTLIVGGGIVGLATAYQLHRKNPDLSICLLEKEDQVGAHQSTHNSGVLHAGLAYKPGSYKARLSVRGIRMMIDFCQEHDIAHDVCGKLVVATNEAERAALQRLWERGNANGLQGLRKLGPEAMREIEPHVRGVEAIRVPEEGIADYRGVVDKLAELLRARGVDLRLGTAFEGARQTPEGLRIKTSRGDLLARRLISCGGLHADRVVRRSQLDPGAKIVPFRGEYYQLRPEKQYLVKHLIYPVPNPKFPFLGVHFTRLVHGGIEAGPNAVLATAREGYTRTRFHAGDLAEALTYPGLWRFMRRYPKICTYEVYRSLSKREFARSLQKLVPAVQAEDLAPGGAGVRAQAMNSSGALIDDFHFVEGPNMLHVVNAPSPAATASLAIGETIADKFLVNVHS